MTRVKHSHFMKSRKAVFRLSAIGFLVLAMGTTCLIKHQQAIENAPALKAFFHLAPDDFSENAAILAYGLAAPENVGLETTEWAQARLKKNRERVRILGHELSAAKTRKEKSILFRKIEQARLEHVLSIDTEGDQCYYKRHFNREKYKPENCYTQERAEKLLAAHRFQLDRYEQMNRYDAFDDLSVPVKNGNLMASLHRVFLLDLIVQSETNPQLAAQRWLDNARFLKKAILSENGFATRTHLMSMYAYSQIAMPVIIQDWSIIRQNRAAYLALLSPFGPREMRVQNMLKGELRIHWSPFTDRLSPVNKMKFYRFMQDYVALSGVSSSEFRAAERKFQSRYNGFGWPDITQPGLSHTSDKILQQAATNSGMIVEMYKIDMRNRLLNLYIRMKEKDASPKEFEDCETGNQENDKECLRLRKLLVNRDLALSLPYDGMNVYYPVSSAGNEIWFYDYDLQYGFKFKY